MDYLISTTMSPWVTDTADGNFIPTLIEDFRAAVTALVHATDVDPVLPIPPQVRTNSDCSSIPTTGTGEPAAL
jgi:hypothetical protein